MSEKEDFSDETMKSLLVKVRIKDKKIKKVISKQIKLNEFYQPEIK